MVTGRLAPTPSGRMHLGNVFSCLLCWLSARSQKGRVVLRIEDLDTQRTSLDFTRQIMDDLLWLGLGWDEGPHDVQDPLRGAEDYFQSHRTAFYEQALDALRQKALVYPCFCSRAQLHAATAPHQSDGNYVYSGTCRALSPAQQAERARLRGGALRVAVPDETVIFTDGLQGRVEENLAKDCGDFILQRSDGVFAYQLAAPADDGAMGVTQVVRGRDLLPSTARQIWLMQTLGYTPPQYFHIPMLLAPDGRRLAKRDKDTDMAALRQRYKTPEPLLGFLAHKAGLLQKNEPAAAAELASAFHWQKVRKEDILIEGDDC